MKLLIDLLTEKSKVSMLRFLSLICIICSCIIACYGVVVGRDLIGLAGLCTAFIAPAFAGKVAQKYMENK